MGLVLCVIFGFMLLCNLTIIVKGTIFPEKPPSIFGITPMVVLSGSMSGDAKDHIEAGDLIFARKVDADKLVEGNIISFMEEDSTSVTTHRIIEIIVDENGEHTFITKGDANNVEDMVPVTEDRIVGIYQFRIPKVGDYNFIMKEEIQDEEKELDDESRRSHGSSHNGYILLCRRYFR